MYEKHISKSIIFRYLAEVFGYVSKLIVNTDTCYRKNSLFELILWFILCYGIVGTEDR